MLFNQKDTVWQPWCGCWIFSNLYGAESCLSHGLADPRSFCCRLSSCRSSACACRDWQLQSQKIIRKHMKTCENCGNLWLLFRLLLCGTRKCRLVCLVCLVVFAHFGAPLKGTQDTLCDWLLWRGRYQNVWGWHLSRHGSAAVFPENTRVAKLKDTLG